MAVQVWLKAGHTVEIMRRRAAEFSAMSGEEVEISVVDEEHARAALIAGDARPDVVTAPYWYLDELIELDILGSLDLAACGLEPTVFPRAALEALSRDGTPYAVPHTFTGGVLSYRRDWFEELGIAAPRSLSDVTDAHVRLRAAGRPGLMARSNPTFSSFEAYAGWAAARGVSLLDALPLTPTSEGAHAVADLISLLRDDGTRLVGMDYSALGDAFVAGAGGMLFDTSAWSFRFEAPGSPVRGRIGYAVIGETHPARFFYAEGLAIPRWSENRAAAQAFIRWRHSLPVLRQEVTEIGRIDIPRLDMRSESWFIGHVTQACLAPALAAIDEAWEGTLFDDSSVRPDYVPAAAAAMEEISRIIETRDGVEAAR